MHRFFINRIPEKDVIVLSDPGQLHHMRDVLRLSVGDEVIVCDDAGHECVCSIKRIAAIGVHLEIKEKKVRRNSGTTVIVACAIPKKGKMDDIIDKLTQLGVEGIIPMQTARVVALPSESARAGKLERWQRIARAASQQSQRDHVPVISPITEFEMVLLNSKNYDLKLVLTLTTDARNIRNIIADTKPENILLLVGPEGDFTPEEIDSARDAGFVPTSLGTHILRVETAAVAVTAYLSLAVGI
jgi:16S rRNA (uracil1498-N3)-methyltransferase